jgi:DNA polymerase-3 subunit gamma/tau
MTVNDTVAHLKQVAAKEGITCEDEALAVIAEKADGGMRDALSIFDQAASFCQGNITYKKVIEDLNVLDSEYYFRLVDYALQNKVSESMVLLNDIIGKGFDGGLLVQGLARHVRNVLMARDAQTLPLLEVSESQRQRYQEQALRAPIPFLYKALQLMNQCDINYRQSSNKRLLVELTLIEVAQLTQPEDAPGSGRKPRRLKSLFKNLIQQTQPRKAAPQVAAAVRAESQQPQSPAATPTATVQVATVKEQPKPAKPAVKLGALGMSWRNLRAQQQKPVKINTLPGQQVTDEHQPFTQDELELQWLSMCNRMPQQLVGVASRMKNMKPVITELPKVEVVVSNEMIMAEVEKIRGSVLNTLKLHLHNSDIELTLRLDEHRQEVRLLTRREQFEELMRMNPVVAKLKAAFDLDIA